MILFTLDIKYFKKQSIVYLFISIFCILFCLIYEMFSHNVYSSYMRKAFLIPLIFGFCLSIIIYIFKLKRFTNRISINLYNASLATFTLYCFIRGVLEIYGTTNSLINLYLVIGTILIILSIFILLIRKEDKNV